MSDVFAGAPEAGVPTTSSWQAHGGPASDSTAKSGPWQPGTPRQGYQLPFTPAERFRTALSAINKDLAGRPFAKMTPDISIFEPCFAPQYAGGCASGFRVRWGAMR